MTDERDEPEAQDAPEPDPQFVRMLQLAESGHPMAQAEIARRLQEGEGVEEDRAQAVHWWHRAAAQGHRQALVQLGLAYRDGRGVAADESAAVQWFEAAADMGDGFAMLALSVRSNALPMWSTDADRAWLLKAAMAGIPQAQLGLARLLPRIDASETARAHAALWLHLAADAGDADAQYEYAHALYHGIGIAADVPTSVSWVRRAADQGHVAAMRELGKFHLQLTGPGEPITEAMHWLGRAAARGDVESAGAIGVAYLDHGQPMVGITWLRMAASQGSIGAKCMLAKCYRDGRGVEADPVEACALLLALLAQYDMQRQLQSGQPDDDTARRARELLAELRAMLTPEQQQRADARSAEV